jgi:hypothetical protein
MEIILTKFDKPRMSKHGSYYIRCYFKCLEDNKSYRLDVYEAHASSARWLPYIKEQAIFSNVKIYKNNIIDGTSNFIFKYIKK